MTIQVEVVATDTIKPSSQKPNHLKTFPLSGIDQYNPPIYTPYLLVYPATSEDKTQTIHRLKQSLGETLTHVYPLAGRISDNIHIVCNDHGINFFEARVSGDILSQFLVNPEPEEVDKLFPRHDHLLVLEEKVLLSVQVNFFTCGGMALGVFVSHKFADAFGSCLFLNFWARIARGEEVIHPPKLGAASTFPPINLPALPLLTVNPLEKLVTKRFVFNTANIASLRANNFTKQPSRATTVISLIWRCAMNTGRAEKGSVAMFSVNLRRKQLPDLPENSLGNCYVCTTTSPTSESNPELEDLVDKLKEAIRIVDTEFEKQLKAGDLMFLQPFGEVNERCSKGELERYSFASLCNFPFYECDFGWGKPIWATCMASIGCKNVFLLTDTKCGTGVEAWVTLDEQDMDRFEHDLISFLWI